MPTLKKRQMTHRQTRLRKKKREGLLRLNLNEKSLIERQKRELNSQKIVFHQYHTTRSLREVNGIHGKSFGQLVLAIAKRKPEPRIVRVLDEGAGGSTLISELAQTFKGIIQLRGVKTDLAYPGKKSRNQVAPEQLVERFGKNRFDLVVTTFGGVTYTPIRREKAIANIIEVLQPEGIASIAVAENQLFTGGRFVEEETLQRLRRRYPHVQIQSQIVARRKGLFEVENQVITIKK